MGLQHPGGPALPRGPQYMGTGENCLYATCEICQKCQSRSTCKYLTANLSILSLILSP